MLIRWPSLYWAFLYKFYIKRIYIKEWNNPDTLKLGLLSWDLACRNWSAAGLALHTQSGTIHILKLGLLSCRWDSAHVIRSLECKIPCSRKARAESTVEASWYISKWRPILVGWNGMMTSLKQDENNFITPFISGHRSRIRAQLYGIVVHV